MLFDFRVYTLICAAFLLLAGCGVPGPGGGSNNFDDPDRGELDPDAQAVSVGITVEATSRMLNQAASSTSILTFDDIDCESISVVQLNFDFQESTGAPDIPAFTSKKRTTTDRENTQLAGCQIEFVENFEPRINAVVKVEFPNREVLYAPLRRTESAGQSIVVSFGSHLALETLFSKIGDSIELARHLPCTGNTDCETQHRAKARLLSFLAETARLYEYEEFADGGVSGETAAEVLTLLRTKSDLMTHLNAASAEIVRSESPIAKGTVRSSYDTEANADILDGGVQTRLRPTDEYNSVLFAMGFVEDPTDSNENKMLTFSSHIADVSTSDKLPKLIHNAYYLDYRYDDILPNIPFEMTTLRLKTNTSSFVVDPTLPENRYAFLTSPEQENGSLVNGTHLSSQGFFLNDRAIAQSIPEVPSGLNAIGVGYDFNPVYYKLFRINEYEPDTSLDSLIGETTPDYGQSPTWFTGTGYGFNGVYQIRQTAVDPIEFERQDLLETQRYFSWEVHGLKTSADLVEADINGSYDVVEFSVDLDDNNAADEVITARAETLVWSTSGTNFIEQQNTAHYRTRELVRNESNAVVERSDFVRTDLSSRSFNLYEADLVDDNNVAFTGPNGLLTLDGQTRSNSPLGHVSENGDHMAFAIDRSNNNRGKRGIILASRQRTDAIQLADGFPLDFTLSGHYIAMETNAHRMVSVDESRLSIAFPTGAEDCDASLDLKSVTVEHRLDSNPQGQLLAPVDDEASSVSSTACSITNGQIEIQFTLPNSDTLTLRGFAMIEDGASGQTVKQINLLWLQDGALGLTFAQIDQDLSAEFSN